MGATSVTGIGLGDSGGVQKPDNHCGCGCCGKAEETTHTTTKRGCVTRYASGGRASYRTGQRASIRVC